MFAVPPCTRTRASLFAPRFTAWPVVSLTPSIAHVRQRCLIAWKSPQSSFFRLTTSRNCSRLVMMALMLETPEDYALVTTRLIEWLAEQKVKYAEVTLSAGVILWKKQSVAAVFEAISSA